MTSSLHFAGAAALGAALLLTACAKKTDQTTTTSTDATTATSAPAAATAAPDAATTAAPAAAATGDVKVDVKSGGGSAGFIDMPVYPGASEDKSQEMSMSANGGSLTTKVFTTGDDPKKVADWYKSHLPAAWKGGVMTAGDKTVGTFANEIGGDGNQSVLVANQDDKTTRIQLTTKRGK